MSTILGEIEPVAWQWRFKSPMHNDWRDGRVPENPYATFGSSWSGVEIETEERPLFAAPPQVEPAEGERE